MTPPAATAASSSTSTNERNWLLELAYDGSNYAGWQIQPGEPTVQGTLRDALSRLFAGETLEVQGCSRTDAGVHALAQMVSFRPPDRPPNDPDTVCKALNARLPADIRVLGITGQAPGFNARRDAKAKAYTYLVHRGRLRSPFLNRYCWQLKYELDLDKMRQAAAMLRGTHDFAAFTVNLRHQQREHTNCSLYAWHLRRAGSFIAITVIGASFLYRMVRRLTGYLVEVGRGRLEAQSAAGLLTAGEPHKVAFETAPPQGLFLERVFFDDAGAAYIPRQLPFLQLLDLDKQPASFTVPG